MNFLIFQFYENLTRKKKSFIVRNILFKFPDEILLSNLFFFNLLNLYVISISFPNSIQKINSQKKNIKDKERPNLINFKNICTWSVISISKNVSSVVNLSKKKNKRNINRHFDFDQKFVTKIQFPVRKKKKFLKLTRKRRKEINSISNPNEILSSIPTSN